MKIKLNREEKAALLVAISAGELDTDKVPRLYKEIKGTDSFFDFLIETGLLEDEEDEGQKNDNPNQQHQLSRRPQ